jgi:high-affinity iron transporter
MMFGTAVIVFREVLEASLIIGIIAAATHEVPKRNYWLVAGLVLGLVGASLVAAFTDVIANFSSGVGQEIFNASVLGSAVLMLAWHNIWMSSHGAELASNARNVSVNIQEGRSERSILMLVVSLAILREGSETVLFLYGIAASGSDSISSMLTGGILGALAGISLGYTIYSGLLRIPLRWFFTATGLLVLLMAAGMASSSARYLIQADILPSLVSPLWDSSGFIPENGLLGMSLHSLIGYEARPAAMQVIIYMAVLLVIGIGMKSVGSAKKQTQTRGAIKHAS